MYVTPVDISSHFKHTSFNTSRTAPPGGGVGGQRSFLGSTFIHHHTLGTEHFFQRVASSLGFHLLVACCWIGCRCISRVSIHSFFSSLSSCSSSSLGLIDEGKERCNVIVVQERQSFVFANHRDRAILRVEFLFVWQTFPQCAKTVGNDFFVR